MLNHRSFLRRTTLLLALGLAGCSSYEVIDRAEGDRTPPGAQLDPETGLACDALDPGRCLLPWPSNTFTEADPTTATGLRLRVDPSSINPRDDGSSLSAANGFSRVTPIATLFDAPLDPATLHDAVRLVLAQHDHPERGHEVPLRVETVTTEAGLTLITADPREVLEANADYVVVVTDALRHADQSTPTAPRSVRAALALEPPTSPDEAALAGYHAPTRRLLEELAIPADGVLRVWDFTTRSEDDARRELAHVRDASLAAVDDAGVVIDSVETSGDPSIAMIVVGRLTGLPTFLDDENLFVRGEDGLPMALGTSDSPFRVVVPAGTEDYRFVMYGHGMAGDEYDRAFDGKLAAHGVAKVNVRIYGWTGDEVVGTFANLRRPFEGSFAAAASIVEAVGHAAAIQRAMYGALADTLSADTIAGVANPAAGRRPHTPTPIWVGGSLGGTVGLIYAAADPDMRYGVLNVPAAAWSQWVWNSSIFAIIRGLLGRQFRDDIDLALALAIAQTNLDLADGASWADVLEGKPTALLIQESMGDPIVPNAATEMVAVAAGAQHVGGVLEPIVGVPTASEVVEGSAITQFRTSDTGEFAVHGFADRNTPAGEAAREQILHFLDSAWAGESIIAPPPTCPDHGCDFSN